MVRGIDSRYTMHMPDQLYRRLEVMHKKTLFMCLEFFLDFLPEPVIKKLVRDFETAISDQIMIVQGEHVRDAAILEQAQRGKHEN